MTIINVVYQSISRQNKKIENLGAQILKSLKIVEKLFFYRRCPILGVQKLKILEWFHCLDWILIWPTLEKCLDFLLSYKAPMNHESSLWILSKRTDGHFLFLILLHREPFPWILKTFPRISRNVSNFQITLFSKRWNVTYVQITSANF